MIAFLDGGMGGKLSPDLAPRDSMTASVAQLGI